MNGNPQIRPPIDCQCKWPDDFCDHCEHRFSCGQVSEKCPDCGLMRTADRFHDPSDAAFNRVHAPKRFHPVVVKG